MASKGKPDASYAATIAAFAAAIDASALRPDVIDSVTTRIIDTLGCIRGAASSVPVEKARRVQFAFGGHAGADDPSATVIGVADRMPVEAAAFINGIAARYLDFNDIYLSREAMHPSDNVAVALALAEAFGCNGRALVLAVARGYEVHCRLADSVSTRKGGWDNVILGAIAASVMAGSLLKLDPEAQAQAINIAATGNVALMQTRVGALSMWKAVAAAYAARAGLFAALLARYGITGPNQALEGTHGLFAKVTGIPDAPAFADIGRDLRVLETHLKAYPSQYFTQTAVDAALALRPRIIVEAIRRIDVSTFEFGRVAAADSPEKWRPETRETADHSMPYCVAVALLDGALGERQFTLERMHARDVQSLLPLIHVVEDPEFTAKYPARVPTRIVVENLDGSQAESTVEYPTGHSRNPMPREQVEAKFVDLAGTAATPALLSRLWRIDSMSDTELADVLCAALR